MDVPFRSSVALAALLTLALPVALRPAPAAAADAPAKATKSLCPAGMLPRATARKGKAVVLRDTKGRLRCAAPVVPKRKAVPATSGARQQVGRVADALETSLDLAPAARKRLDKAIGKRNATKLLDRGLTAWRGATGAASAARAHAADTTTMSFGGTGAGGKATLEVADAGGGNLGQKIGLTAEIDVTRKGLEDLSKGAADSIPSGVKGGKAVVKLTFSDVIAPCPSASGTVAGRLDASGSITVTVETADGAVAVTLSATASMTYTLKVGEDGHWSTISDTDLRTKFEAGGTGQKTKTYRARVTGDGYGTSPIFGEGSASDAIQRDLDHANPDSGYVSGPLGTEVWEKGRARTDLSVLLDLEAMGATVIATHLLQLAAVEYVRHVAAPNAQKHWYDEEACLALDASAAATQLQPSQTTTVTVGPGRAKDGGTVPGALTATGVASLVPSGATLPAGGTLPFTLTAPPKKGSATWQVVMVSRAGKKTVSGAIPVVEDELPLRFAGSVRGTIETRPGGTLAEYEEWSAALSFERTDQTTNPDGTKIANYRVTRASVQHYRDDLITPGPCGNTFRFETSGDAPDGDGGALELQVSAQGVRTAAFRFGVAFSPGNHVAINPPPLPGCQTVMETTGATPTVVFNGRDRNDDLRAVDADGHLRADGTTDLPVNAGQGYATTTATWDLAPGT